MSQPDIFNAELDLQFERIIEIRPELVWAAWTEPRHIKHWFTPAPWKTIDCEIDLRPGGIFRTTMQSPEGQAFPNLGCYLEVVAQRKLVWTNALGPSFRPMLLAGDTFGEGGPFAFTATIAMVPHGEGTRYTAKVMHADAAGREQHAAMGFEAGWSAALEQLVAYMKKQ